MVRFFFPEADYFSITFKAFKRYELLCHSKIIEFVLPLRVNRVDISGPKPIVEGSTVCLKCLYKLNKSEKFNGIEWFKDGESILNLTPGTDNQFNNRSVPFKLAFVIDGVDVDVSLSFSL